MAVYPYFTSTVLTRRRLPHWNYGILRASIFSFRHRSKIWYLTRSPLILNLKVQQVAPKHYHAYPPRVNKSLKVSIIWEFWKVHPAQSFLLLLVSRNYNRPLSFHVLGITFLHFRLSITIWASSGTSANSLEHHTLGGRNSATAFLTFMIKLHIPVSLIDRRIYVNGECNRINL